MELTKQQLIEQLKHSFPQLAGEGAPLTIKMGRNVVFKGSLDAPTVDKLTESHLALLESALNVPTNDGSTLEAVNALRGTINIEVGDQKVFRYANGQVEVNALQSQVQQEQSSASAIETRLEMLVSTCPVELVERPDHLIKVAPVSDREFFATDLHAALGDRSLHSIFYTLVPLDRQDLLDLAAGKELADPETFLDQVREEVAVDSYGICLQGDEIVMEWFDELPDGLTDEQRFQQAMDRGAAEQSHADWENEMLLATMDSVERTEGLTLQGIEGKNEGRVLGEGDREEGKEEALVSADTIAVLELHDQLPPSARQWMLDKFQEVAQSGIGEELKAKGATAARATLEGLKSASTATRDRAICDSALTLVKNYGTLDMSQETPQMVYQAEGYTIRLQSSKEGALSLNDLKSMNQCTVETDGNPILSFTHEGIRGLEVTHNTCTLDQQFDLVRAGAYLAGNKTHQAIQTAGATLKAVGEQLGTISQGLANLAPEGTRERLASFQHHQVAAVAKVLASSKDAIATVGQGRFEVSQSGDETTIGIKGVGAVFRQVGNQISTRMAAQDTQSFIEVGKKLARALTTSRSSGRD